MSSDLTAFILDAQEHLARYQALRDAGEITDLSQDRQAYWAYWAGWFSQSLSQALDLLDSLPDEEGALLGDLFREMNNAIRAETTLQRIRLIAERWRDGLGTEDEPPWDPVRDACAQVIFQVLDEPGEGEDNEPES